MPRRQLGVLLAIGSGTIIVVICWVILLLQAEPPEPTVRPIGAVSRGPETAPVLPTGAEPAGPPTTDRPQRMEVEPERTGPDAIFGRVIDAQTRQPVTSFQVAIMTDGPGSPINRANNASPEPFHPRSGIFRIDKKPGTYDVVVRAPGYEPAVLDAYVVPALDRRPQDIELSRGPGIVGLVYDHQNVAVPAIKVFLHTMRLDDPLASPPRMTVGHTGDDGTFHFAPLPPGEYAVSLLELRNTVDYLGAIRVYAGETTQVSVYMFPRHQLQLIVQDERGQPVRGVSVELRGENHYQSGRSSDTGQIVIEHVPDGTYEIRASHRNYENLVEPLELIGGQGRSVRWLNLVSRETGD